MFHYMSGTYKGIVLDHVILDVNGFGMKIFMPETVREKLPKAESPLTVYTELVTGEGFMNLYGFLTVDELKLFNLLINKVPSVGPKGAISILSTLTPKELLFAVSMSDVKSITRAKGIGAKTAERIILELKDRIELFEAGAEISEEITREDTPGMSLDNEVLDALLALGYTRQEFYQVAGKLDKSMSVEQQIKRALFLLSMKK